MNDACCRVPAESMMIVSDRTTPRLELCLQLQSQLQLSTRTAWESPLAATSHCRAGGGTAGEWDGFKFSIKPVAFSACNVQPK